MLYKLHGSFNAWYVFLMRSNFTFTSAMLSFASDFDESEAFWGKIPCIVKSFRKSHYMKSMGKCHFGDAILIYVTSYVSGAILNQLGDIIVKA